MVRLLVVGVLLCCSGEVRAQDSTYTVRPGDTLYSISRSFNVSLDSLRVWNSLDNAGLRAGMSLVTHKAVPNETNLPDVVRLGDVFRAWGLTACACPWADSVAVQRIPPDRSPSTYTVRRGDTLFGIARAHGVSIEEVRRSNSMAGNDIQIGQVLRIPGSDGSLDADGPGVLPPVSEEVGAVVYPAAMVGRRLEDGSRYSANRHVIGHPDLPIGTWVVLEAVEAGLAVPALVADRSPTPAGSLIDLSQALALELGLADAPDQRVLLRIVPYERSPR